MMDTLIGESETLDEKVEASEMQLFKGGVSLVSADVEAHKVCMILST